MPHHPGTWAFVACIIVVVLIGTSDARIAITSQSPTYPDSAQSTPYIGFHITPDDVLSLNYSEILRFQPPGNVPPEVYEVSGSIPYVEYDIVLDGYVPHDIRMEQSTTFSSDTLGIEETMGVPTTSEQVVQPREPTQVARRRLLQQQQQHSSLTESHPPVVVRQLKSFAHRYVVAKRTGRVDRGGESGDTTRIVSSGPARKLLLGGDSTAIDGSLVNQCFAQSSSPDEVSACVNVQSDKATSVASRLNSQSILITQMKNFALRFSTDLKLLNGTFSSLLESLEAQLAVDNNQSEAFDALLASFSQIQKEEAAAKAALEASRAAVEKHNEYGQNATQLAIAEASRLAVDWAAAVVDDATEEKIVGHFLNVLLELTTQSHAQLAFQSQQLTFSSSVIRGQAEILTAMMRNDQTRADEITQQNDMRATSRRDGWKPWVFNDGQAPVEQLPTAAHVETLGYTDYFWADATSRRVFRDHHVLLCDVQQLTQNFRTQQIATFVDLFSLFASQPCFGAGCVCRMHRSRHVYTGADAALVMADVGGAGPFPTDAYATLLRTWMTQGNWSQTLAERVPTETIANCSYSDFDPTIDVFVCADARLTDHATAIPTTSFDGSNATARAVALSTASWTFVSASWFSTVAQVSTLLQDQCMTTTHVNFPYQRRLGMLVTDWQLLQPEPPAARTYCNTAFDTLTTSAALGRPFMLLAMQESVGFHRAWRERRQAALQTVFDGYAASPQITESQPFHYELVQNNTIPVLLKARHMLSTSVSPDAEPFQTLRNRRAVHGLTLRRLLSDPALCQPACTHNDYQEDPSFVPIRLGTTMVQDDESVSGLDGMPPSLKWMGYGKCLYESCPLRVLNMTRDPALSPTSAIGIVTGVQHAVGAGGTSYVGWRYILDTSDGRTVASTSEGALRDSDTYGFIPIGQSTAFASTAMTASQRANPFGALGADGVTRRFMSPSLYQWSQAHQGAMDPRHVGAGVRSYAVEVESLGGNPFNIRCKASRGAVSDKCLWLDKRYVDFDVERGTARFYARNWNLRGLLPMPDQGNVLLSIITACPEDTQVHSEVLLQTSIEMTNTVFKPNQFVYVVSSICPGASAAGASLFLPEGKTEGSLLDAIIGKAWANAVNIPGGVGGGPAPSLTSERDMTSWIPYQTHSAMVAGCKDQTVEVYASTEALATDTALFSFMADSDLFTAFTTLPAASYALVSDPHSEANTTAVGIAFAAVQEKANELVRAFVTASSASTTVSLGGSGDTVTIRPATRCMRWQAPDTVVLARDVESTVVTKTQIVRDDISAAFRSVQENLNFASAQSFTVTQNIINNLFLSVDLATLDAYRQSVDAANTQNADTQAMLRNLLATSNTNAAANAVLIAQGQAAQNSLLVSPDAIAGLLRDLTETTALRKQLLIEEAAAVDRMRLSLANFSAQLVKMDAINYAFRPPLDMLPEDLARTLALSAMVPCPIDALDTYDASNFYYKSDNSWLGGPLRPLRAFLTSLGVLALAWIYIQYVSEVAQNKSWYQREKTIGAAETAREKRAWMYKRTCCCFRCGDGWYAAW